MELKVTTDINKINKKKWADFVYHHPQGNIFQTPEMYEVYENTKNYQPIFVSVIDEKDEILGVLLAVVQREYRGLIGDLSARSIIWGGPLVKDNNLKVFKLILREYNKIAKKKAIYSQFRNLWDMQKFKDIFDDFGYYYEEHLNIIIDLRKSEELLWKEVHSKRRNEIRRALKEKTFVQELKKIGGVEKAYQILYEVYKYANLPIADLSLFKSAFQVLGPKKMIKYFGAFNGNEFIGVICILAYRGTLYDWYAGSLKKHLNKYPNDLLPWEVFKWGKENGYTVFDFGGAGKPDEEYGVRDYKKKFGGQLANYGRFEKIHQPVKFKVAKAGFKLWQKVK